MSDTPPEKRRRRLKPEQRRAELIDAAMRLFGERGLERVTTADIATAADIAEGLLFHYFPTKHDLTLAVINVAADRLIAALHNLPPAAPRQQLTNALDAYLTHVQNDPVSWRILLLSSDHPEILGAYRRVEDASVALVMQVLGIDVLPPTLRLVLTGWFGFERTVSARWLEDPTTPKEHVIALLEGALLGASAAAAAIDSDVTRLLQPLLNPPASS